MSFDITFQKMIHRLKLGWHAFRHGRLPEAESLDLLPLMDEDLEEIRSIFPMDKFFIFGHARSGTTLLARLIRLHPDVHAGRLGHFVTFRRGVFSLISQPSAQHWIQRPSKYWNNDKNLSTKIMRSVCDFILEKEARKAGKTVVGDKSNNNTVNARAIERLHLIYPDAKIIFLVRDGRDVVLSQRFRFFIDLPKYLDREGLKIRKQLASDPDAFLEGNASVFTTQELGRVANNWVENVTETHMAAQNLYGDQYHVLTFEEMTTNPYDTMEKLWVFLGVAPDFPGKNNDLSRELDRNPDKKWQASQDDEIIQNLEKGKSGTWKDLFTERDKKIFKDIAGGTLIEWGYEDDFRW